MRCLLRCALAIAALTLGSAAAAQRADEWSTFQPAAAPATAPAAQPAAAPASASPTPAPAEPATLAPLNKPKVEAPPPTVPQTSAGAAALPASPASDSGLPATTVNESVLPGTAPHSPATAGHGLADDNSRVMSGSAGATGLLRLGSADLGKPGVIRLSVLGQYFSGANFPVLNARDVRSAGSLTIDWTALEFLEAYLSYTVAANTNTRSSPQLMQTQGDAALGLKAAKEFASGLHLGADLRVMSLPGVGGQDLSGYAFGFAPQLLATYDVRKASPKVPLRLHLNAGLVLDGSSRLVSSAHKLTAAEEFALGISQYNRFSVGLGLEAPLPWVTPFVEYGFGYPLSAGQLVGPDNNPVTAASAMPQLLTLGGKVTALRDVAFIVACDLGLSQRVAKGIPATPPYNVWFGVTYNFDPMAKGETRLVEKTTFVEKKVEVATAPPVYTGKIGGAVFDAQTKQPIAGVVVGMPGAGLPPVATDVDAGKFVTHELPAGKINLTFAREGYKPAAVEAVVEAGKLTALQAFLERDVKNATVKIALVSGRQKVAGKLVLAGPKSAELTVKHEGATLDLPKGHYTATVDAEGFLSKVKEFDVPETGEVNLEVDLAAVPKKVLVVVKEDRIQIKQQVHFATGKATILNDSFQLLDQVVDAMLRANLKKIRVEGHTDNQGGKDANMKLSAARAQAVADYLTKKGIPQSRVVAEGFGDTKPVAPNLTARGRELNRRVEFMIVEH